MRGGQSRHSVTQGAAKGSAAARPASSSGRAAAARKSSERIRRNIVTVSYTHLDVYKRQGELRRAYQALRRAHEDLKTTQQQLVHSEKMASLGRLVAGVAHELNNPISFVYGNAVALKRYAERLTRYLLSLIHI